MAGYRNAAEETRRARLRWGPFTPPWSALGFGLLFTFIGGLSLFMIEQQTIICQRTGPSDPGACTEHHDWVVFASDGREVALADVRELRWIPYDGDKGGDKGRTALLDAIGREVTFADGPRDDARRAYEAIRGFREDPEMRRTEATMPRGWIGVLFAMGFLAVGVVAFHRFVTAVTWFSLVIDREAQRLVVRAFRLGVPGRAVRYDISGVREVHVEEGTEASFLATSWQRPHRAWRLVLHSRAGGPRRPLSWRFHRNEAAHERAQIALARALDGLADIAFEKPESKDEAERQALATEQRTKASAARRRALLVWGAIVAALIGASAVYSVVARIGKGTLVVQCEARCRYGGIECLPGGSWSDAFDPGIYAIEVYDVDAPGHWVEQQFEIEVDRTTTFVCTPQPSASDP